MIIFWCSGLWGLLETISAVDTLPWGILFSPFSYQPCSVHIALCVLLSTLSSMPPASWGNTVLVVRGPAREVRIRHCLCGLLACRLCWLSSLGDCMWPPPAPCLTLLCLYSQSYCSHHPCCLAPWGLPEPVCAQCVHACSLTESAGSGGSLHPERTKGDGEGWLWDWL